MAGPPHFLAPFAAPGAARATLGLFVGGRDRPIVTSLEAAVDSATRRRGLLGRNHLNKDAALVLAPTSAVHTFFMRFPIDLVFAARDGRVLKVREHVRPWRVSGARGAFAVVELAAGTVTGFGLKVGDRLRVDAAR